MNTAEETKEKKETPIKGWGESGLTQTPTTPSTTSTPEEAVESMVELPSEGKDGTEKQGQEQEKFSNQRSIRAKKSTSEKPKKNGIIRYSKDYMKCRLWGLGREEMVFNKKEINKYLIGNFGALSKDNGEICRYESRINLTTPHYKAVDALLRINHDLSTNKTDRKAEDYYKGNGERKTYKPKDVEGAVKERMAVIDTDWATFARYYYDRSATGNEIIKAKNILISLRQQIFPILLSLTGRTDRRVVYHNLIHLEHDELGDNVRIVLHPIMTRGLEKYYIPSPDNSMQRLIEAHGNSRLPRGLLDFYDYLLNDKSNKHYNRKFKVLTLCNMIARENMENRHPKDAIKAVFQTLSELKQMGLIKDYSPDGGNGIGMDNMVEVNINPDYQ